MSLVKIAEWPPFALVLPYYVYLHNSLFSILILRTGVLIIALVPGRSLLFTSSKQRGHIEPYGSTDGSVGRASDS